MVEETWGSRIADIVVYNSSLNFPNALYLGLSLAVGHCRCIFSQNSFNKAGFGIDSLRTRV